MITLPSMPVVFYHIPMGSGTPVQMMNFDPGFNCLRNRFRASTLKPVSLEPVPSEATCTVGFKRLQNNYAKLRTHILRSRGLN